MKKVLFSAMALTMGLMMLVSCNKEKKVSKEAVFTANIEQHIGQQGRTAINPLNGDVKWLAGDKILVTNGNGETAEFTLQSGAGSTEGTFRTTGEFEMTEPFTAVYPQTATLSGTTTTFNLPATQTLTQTGTFANGANPMAAYGTDENLYFKNLCGGLDVRLLGDNIHVSGIRITGAEGEKLNGTFTVDCSANEPVLMVGQGTNGTNIVTLNCDVTLTSTTTAQEFFIVLPVGALAQGFTMEVLDGENIICTKQLQTNLAQIVRNEVKRFNPLLIVNETPIPIELPDVTTAQVTGITTTSATAGGEIVSDGGSTITECGVCWSTEQEPTIDGDHIASQVTMGEFSVTVAGLIQNTTYYLRAYATNEAGTGYGDVVNFTTQEEIVITVPTVTTDTVTEITTTTATVGGQITSAGNGTISESGICYKTGNEDWTCVALTATNNAFSTTLTDLTPNTTYTVRAYATNEEGTGYGEEVSFTTIDLGIINGVFTINANGDQVYFSKGNLQYNKTTNEWSFMEHQYDIVETADQDVGENYANQNIVSLFCWGTSGYNHGAMCYQPWSTQTGWGFYYYAYGNSSYNLFDQTGQADWGYNAIANGGNAENSGWRTPTRSEWDYVLFTRNTASGIRWTTGSVNGVNGVILLPDNWTASIYMLNGINSPGSYSINIISEMDWDNILEVNGAVFLPAAGDRAGTTVSSDVGEWGSYWSSSTGSNYAYGLLWGNSPIYPSDGEIAESVGRSVRLVRNIQ